MKTCNLPRISHDLLTGGAFLRLYNGSAGGAGFDLAWAQDGNGNSVDLPSADYIRIDVLSGRTQIDAVSVVPEPSASALGLMGLCLFWLRAKR